MKKNHSLLILIFVLLLVSACNSMDYEANMKAGIKSAKIQRYEEALESFKKAAQEDNTDEVRQAITYTKYMKDSLELFDNGDFPQALSTSQKISTTEETSEILELLKPRALKLQLEATELLNQSVAEVKDSL
ncbi:hypothetical protein [Bacillus tuaregi]|uniref:hypothetical protein n=1 Tax=Bacillus tuaregi TaxID=1816695 RepID=UPI0008F85EFC|nr:hypothetical protein [Bacillus tuaregi]